MDIQINILLFTIVTKYQLAWGAHCLAACHLFLLDGVHLKKS